MINNKLFRGFTFDGVNSLDYDIYITGAGVYNAPERAVEKVSVPGRNGDLTIDQGRFENIEVTYAECGCAATTQEEFAEKVQAFRNALCSRVGYKRLTDDYNKDEYRMAMYVSGLEVEAIAQHRMGTFDIVFDAKPQRFLYTGETPRLLVQGMTPKNLQTESGAIVSVESDGDAVTSLIAQIEPVQAGSGDPSPSNVRPITGWTAANVTVDGSNLFDGVWEKGLINASTGQNVANNSTIRTGYIPVKGGKKICGAFKDFPNNYVFLYEYKADKTYNLTSYETLKNGSITLKEDTAFIRMRADDVITNIGENPLYMLQYGETHSPYEPYHGTTYTVSFGSAGTVYGGTLDVVTGVLTVTHVVADIGTGADTVKIITSGSVSIFDLSFSLMKPSATAANNIMCTCYKPVNKAGFELDNYECARATSSRHIYVRDTRYTTVEAFKSALTGQKFVFELATPQTYNLTAQQVELLTGDNNVWADTGDITITWGDDPYKVVNPTLFASKPLLQVTGRGTLSVGDVTMTITGTASQVLYIDCAIMEVYSITDGQMQPQNSLVTMNSYDFPKLKPGANKITLGVGITQVVVTPRWWRV